MVAAGSKRRAILSPPRPCVDPALAKERGGRRRSDGRPGRPTARRIIGGRSPLVNYCAAPRRVTYQPATATAIMALQIAAASAVRNALSSWSDANTCTP